MKILFLCHRFPFPPKDGSRVRAFHMIGHLSGGNKVTVAVPSRSAAERDAGRGLAAHCRSVITEPIAPVAALARMLIRLPSATPSSMGYFHSPALARRIREALTRERFDLIVVHCSSMAPYVEGVDDVPKLLDFADMDSQKWLAYAHFHALPLSAGYRLEGWKLARAEARLAARFDACTCITRDELDTLRGFGIETASGWFPNGVDLEFFAPGDGRYDPDLLCFVGRMDYFPNQQGMIAFCTDILPRIRAARPHVRVSIVGAEPSRRVRDLAAIPGVTVTGTVPDVRPFVRAAAVSVAPLRIARGTQNKILESWAMGVPVVASGRAAAGVDGVAGEHLFVANDDAAFADAVVRLMADAAERRRLSVAGRERVESRYTWAAAMRGFDDMLDSCRQAFAHRTRRLPLASAPRPAASPIH